MTKKILKKKSFKCLWVRKVVYIFLLRPVTVPQVILKVVYIGHKIPSTLPQVITEVVDIGQLLPATLHLVIAGDTLIEVDPSHKKPATIPLAIG